MTGKQGPVVPKYKPTADFVGVPTTLNQNNTVNYTDQSTVDPLGPPITSWAWTFEGGNPQESTAQNPSNILYATPGTYDVTLTATNADGSGSTTKVDYITVNQYTPPFTIDSWQVGPYMLNVGEYQTTDVKIGTYGINVEL